MSRLARALIALELFCAGGLAAASDARALGSAPTWTQMRLAIRAAHLGEGTLPALFFRPQESGGEASVRRHPAAIVLHGCGGLGREGQLSTRHAMWRDLLLEQGFAVVFPLSFPPRGFTEVCTIPSGERSVSALDRMADVLATAEALRARPDIDPDRLVLIGFSHGGSTVLATLTREPRALGLFRRAIAFYPGCRAYAQAAERGQRLKLASPLTILIGTADDWTPAEPCERWVKALKSEGQPVEIVLYPGAYHGFDQPTGPLRVRRDVPGGVNPGRGVTVGPDPAAREDAKAQVRARLAPLAQAAPSAVWPRPAASAPR
ncbi:MAG: dienelactone hydrolase family protein [Burkholderiales bacterium]|nr:dienelactone hydrolase family protein [Burkholderiales bacterium]